MHIIWRRYKPSQIGYYLFRGATRAGTVPFRSMPEGVRKNRIREFLLKFQHSLPTEFVVNPGDTVCQIGTPWPGTLLRFRNRLGSNGKLVIFEALPANAAKLRETVAKHNFSNVFIIEKAAWSETRPGKLSVSPYIGDHKIAIDNVAMDNDLRPGNDVLQEIDVAFTRIDDVFKDLDIPELNYLSVTVNGAEHEVLKGASGILARSKDIRVYSKGHAVTSAGEPINTGIKQYLTGLGFKAMITKGEPSSTTDERWLWRAGDVYGWRLDK
jgi:FkbM family methyltransferase